MTQPARLALCGALLLAAPSCVSSPRNNAHVDDVSNVPVVGLVPWATDPVSGQPGAKVHVDVFEVSTNKWYDDGVPATADTTASTTDSSGTAWYRFSYGLQPSVPGLWSGSLASHSMSMKLRAYVQGQGHTGNVFDSAHDFALAGFDVGDATDQCMRDHQNGSGSDLINACRSKADAITITADCGSSGKMCCGSGWPDSTNYQCDPGLGCDWQGTCGTCGGADQPPCHGTQCYPLPGGGQRCHLQCASGAWNPSSQRCTQAAPPPPPPPPPPSSSGPTTTAVTCDELQPFVSGYPEYICQIYGNPSIGEQLVSITNPWDYPIALVKNNADANAVCTNPDNANSSQYALINPGSTVTMQSVYGAPSAISGTVAFAICVLPTASGTFPNFDSYTIKYAYTQKP